MGDIVVIGAGPAGLMVALMAAEAGHRVVVREATGDLGGMAGSFEVAGQRVDHGSHRLHPATEPDLMRRLVGLLGADLQTRERRGRIRLCGRWIGFPLRSLDMVRNLPPTFTAGVARDAVTGRFRSADGEGTFTSELTRRLGPTITDQFFAPYAEKLYGLPGTRLSVESADRRVSATSPAKIAGRVLRAARTRGRVFLYPRLGYGQIAERLADAAVAAGAELTFHTAVDTVTLASDHVTVAGPGHSGDADIVWSTMPLPDLSEALDPRPPVEVRAAITELRTRAMVLVYLVVPRPAYTAYDAHYFPDASMRTSRLSEPKNYRDGPDPRDRTVICAEIPCWRDDDLWNADAGALAELVAAELVGVELPDPGAIEVETRRLASVYPVYELATEGSRRLVRSWLRDQRRVVGVGRQGLGVPDNLHHVLAMGRAAADALDGGGRLIADRWRASLDTFALHVVED